MKSQNALRLVGIGGANRAMEAEVKRLAKRGLEAWSSPKPVREDEQTLVYPFDPAFAHLAVNYLRTPSRVLWDIFETEAERLEPLYDDVLAWMKKAGEGWLESGLGISIRARDVEWFPASRTQIQGTIKNGLIEGAKKRGLELALDSEQPDLLFAVRGTKNRLVLSIDLGGVHSNHGYRKDGDRAPLRENVAAQILILSRWDPRKDILIDPMCGSGTIPIEAALMARGAPLWSKERPAPSAKLPVFRAFRNHALEPLFADAEPIIYGNDIHGPAITAARKNADRAGVSELISFIEGDFAKLGANQLRAHSPGGRGLSLDQGLVLVNPPYGERLEEEDEDLERLYRNLAKWAFALGPGWKAGFLVTHPDFEAVLGKQARMKKPVPHGGLSTQLYVYGTDA